MNTYINLYRTLYGFHHSKVMLKNTPLIENIEITNNCNLDCKFCRRDAVFKHRGFGDMSMSLFQKIVDENKDCFQDVMLFHHGEPLMQPKLIDMVQYIRPYAKRKIGFTTNGLILTGEKFKELVEAGLDVVCFSLEPEEAYYYLRGVPYSKVEQNILDCLEVGGAEVQINTILNSQTERYIDDFTEWWRKKGVCPMLTIEGDWLQDTKQGEGSKEPCPAFWVGGVVYYDGTVGACCVWFGEPLADLKDRPLKEQWNNFNFRHMRQLHNQDRRLHYWCGRCSGMRFNENSIYRLSRNSNFPFDSRYLKAMWRKLS